MNAIKVKICGLQSLYDVEAVNEARPDYAGFVFAQSSRVISEEAAKILRAGLEPTITAVGVFVNEDPDKIVRLCSRGIIDIIQLHGDEDEAYIDSLRTRVTNPIIKAVRVRSTEDIIRAGKLDCEYLLLDAFKDNEYGGSGTSFDWSLIPRMNKPFFLAGGLNSNNVLKAMDMYRPYCVDVSSGVETDGRKDAGKIREFVSLVRSVN